MSDSKLIEKISACFHRPFTGLPVLVWAFFVWTFFMQKRAPLWQGAFYDSDDYMHLLRARNLLEGQGWFDLFFHRLSPPDGVLSHFSRLIDAPLALLLWPFHALGLSWQLSSIIVAALWPMFLLAVFLWVLIWCARAFMKEEWVRYTAFVALFSPLVFFQFSLGRVDHHNVAMICTLLSLGSLLRLFEDKQNVKWALLAGFFPALGMAVALETLPWLMIFSAAIGFILCLEGKVFIKAVGCYALSLFLSTALLLLVTEGPTQFLSANPLLFSGLYLFMVGVISMALVLASLSAFVSRFDGRLLVHTLLGLTALFGFLYCFPALKAGPYGQVDPEISKRLLGSIGEAVPLYIFGGMNSVLSELVFPYLAFMLGLFLVFFSEGKERLKWTFLVLLIFISIFLAVAYQARVKLYAELFSLFVYAGAFSKILPLLRKEYKGRKLFWLEIYTVLFLGPLAGIIIPVFVQNEPARDGLILFPVHGGYETSSCGTSGLWNLLNLKGSYGDEPRLIMNMANEGAGILFHTPHKVLAAPYHTNVKGNLDAIHFFRAETPAQAQKIAVKDKIDLVLVCEDISAPYKNQETKEIIDQDGSQKTENENPTFAQQLVEGALPDWLKRVEMPFLGKARLYEVHLEGKP